MPLPYTPYTEDELWDRLLLSDGEYPGKITNVIEKINKNGEPMLQIDIALKKPDGSLKTQKDWITLTEQWAFRFRHLASSCNLIDKYDAKTLEACDFFDKDVLVKLGRRARKLEDGSTKNENFIKDYVAPSKFTPKETVLPHNFPDDVMNF